VADLVDDFTVFNPCPGRRFMAMDSQQESSEPLHEIRRGGQTLTGLPLFADILPTYSLEPGFTA